jgi:hypothetical protein
MVEGILALPGPLESYLEANFALRGSYKLVKL